MAQEGVAQAAAGRSGREGVAARAEATTVTAAAVGTARARGVVATAAAGGASWVSVRPAVTTAV